MRYTRLATLALLSSVVNAFAPKSGELCRHHAKASRHHYETSSTTWCPLPSDGNPSFEEGATIPVDDEWKWVLSPNTVSGQVIGYNHDSVFMISQKSCLDNEHNVRQIRRSYSANNFTYVADFSAARSPHILKGGIFEGCVLSPSNWKDFTSRKKSSANNHIANKQYMLRRRGNDKMVLEHNFDYQSDEIQKVFNNLISNILHEKSSDNDEICESYSGRI